MVQSRGNNRLRLGLPQQLISLSLALHLVDIIDCLAKELLVEAQLVYGEVVEELAASTFREYGLSGSRSRGDRRDPRD